MSTDVSLLESFRLLGNHSGVLPDLLVSLASKRYYILDMAFLMFRPNLCSSVDPLLGDTPFFVRVGS